MSAPSASSARRAWLLPLVALALSLVAGLIVPRLSLDGDLARLFPDDAPARSLASYVRAFGGGDVTTIMVRGDDRSEVGAAASEIAAALGKAPGIERVVDSVASGPDPDADVDPTLAWALADDATLKRLADATGPELRARLAETRSLLLSPGAGALSHYVTRDPLRLWPLVAARARNVASTVGSDAQGALSADEGRARFLLIHARGSTLRSSEAKALVATLEGAIGQVVPRHAGVRAAVVGGVAIARDAEQLIRHDLYLSSALSTLLVSVAFVITFRRPRALWAVLPPLLLGTLWTTALAALIPGGVAAIAMGFGSVVIGVGLDTGVHVYAAVERLRGEPRATPWTLAELSSAARKDVARPTLAAAFAAAFAFASLALSRLPALRQLGLLCASGEVLTALAILALTPTLAAWLTKHPAKPLAHRAAERLGRRLQSPSAARAVLLTLGALTLMLVVFGPPRPSSAIVAVRPSNLPALRAQEEAIALTSGADPSRASGGGGGQLLVLQRAEVAGDAGEQRLLERGEAVARALGGRPEWQFDALASWVPSHAETDRRLAVRDALDLGQVASRLRKGLQDEGFSEEPFSPAFARLSAPADAARAHAMVDSLRKGALEPLVARHLARDEQGHALLATYVRGAGLTSGQLRTVVAAADPAAVVTGYPVLDESLRGALARDLPRVALVAIVLVLLAMRAALRAWRDVGVAFVALFAELVVVALALRLLHVPIHVYDALVLPVLLGITVDESMFLLHALRHGDAAASLVREGRAIVATAVTTAAGFLALLFCGFPGLRDLGAVGLIGTLAGLATSLLVVPALGAAWLRSDGRRA